MKIRAMFVGLALVMATALGATPAAAQAIEAAASPTRPPRIDSALFSAPSEFSRPSISPDGARIAYIANTDGKDRLVVESVGTGRRSVFVNPEGSDMQWFRWAGSGRLLFSMAAEVKFFGEEAQRTMLFVIDIESRETLALADKNQGLRGDDVIYVDPDGEYVLLNRQKTIYDYPAVYRIMLADNSTTKVVSQKANVWDWIADDSGVVRLGVGSRGSATLVYYRPDEEASFKMIGKIKDDDEDREVLDGLLRIITGSDDGFILTNKKTGRDALYKYNYATRAIGELIVGDPTYDITDFSIDRKTGTVTAAYLTDDRFRAVWLDPKMKAEQAKLERTLPGMDVWISSRSIDDSRMIVFVASPNDPGSFYLYEPNARKLDRIAGRADALDPAQLAVTKPVRYKARDGLDIPAYLTLPVGRKATGLPLIVMPHGGPFGVRDTMEFNADVQFLANRGYAVLQPNYRGSSSYGEAFFEKGTGQVGRAMQDDLDDGLDWLVKQGIVDANRVCIMGASYGGYAALWGVIRNPERYRCAVSLAGVTDWKRQLSYDAQFFSRKGARSWRDRVKGEGRFDLDAVSPVDHIDKLTRPVLIAQGDADSNVPPSQYKRFVDAAKKAGKPLETVLYEGEGHGFADPKNQADYYDRVEAFLTKYNPAD